MPSTPLRGTNTTPTPIGTGQFPTKYATDRRVEQFTNYSGGLLSKYAYGHFLVASLVSVPGSGIFLYGPLKPSSSIIVRSILNHGTDADGKTGEFALWGVEEFIDETLQSRPIEYIGAPLVRGGVTGGKSPAAPTGSLILPAPTSGNYRFADTFTIAAGDDRTRGGVQKINADGDDGVAGLLLDQVGATWILGQYNNLTSVLGALLIREL